MAIPNDNSHRQLNAFMIKAKLDALIPESVCTPLALRVAE